MEDVSGEGLTADFWDRLCTASLAGCNGHCLPQLFRIGKQKASMLIGDAIAAEFGAEK